MKNKTTFILLILAILALEGISQVTFTSHIIVDQTSNLLAKGANNAIAFDVDGDLDNDIVSASWEDGKIAWYENYGSTGIFSEQKIIATTAYIVVAIDAKDIDNDGDIDIISGSRTIQGDNGKIALYLNDGVGNFSSEQIIHIGGERIQSVLIADIDGDNNLDVISGAFNGEVGWQKNLDGAGNFGELNILADSNIPARTTFAYDIDNDGDLDITAGFSRLNSSVGNTIIWYENTNGLGEFNNQYVVSTAPERVRDIKIADIDNDNDGDLIFGSYDNKIAWHQNLDGLGNFGEEKIVSTQAEEIFKIHISDIDNDEDIDILAASIGDDKISWFKNLDGQGEMFEQNIITSFLDGASDVFPFDFQNDGDIDIISAAQKDDKVVLFENSLLLSMAENVKLNFKTYPIPVQNYLNIINDSKIDAIKIYNNIGQLLLTETYNTSINLSFLPPGIYHCHITDIYGNYGITKIIKN